MDLRAPGPRSEERLDLEGKREQRLCEIRSLDAKLWQR